RLGTCADVIGFEPQQQHVDTLRSTAASYRTGAVRVEIVHALVGSNPAEGVVSLDRLPITDRTRTLIKVDVEGAEIDVIAGAGSWLVPSNFFVIEVHEEAYLHR